MIQRQPQPSQFLSHDETVDAFTSENSIIVAGCDDHTGKGCALRITARIARDLSAWLTSTANILDGRGDDFYRGDMRVMFSSPDALAAWIKHRHVRIELRTWGTVRELAAFVPDENDAQWQANYASGTFVPDAWMVAATDCDQFGALLAVAENAPHFQDIHQVMGVAK